MKTTVILFLSVFVFPFAFANFPLNPADLIWEEVYTFNRCNTFVIEFYAKNQELMQTKNVRTQYQSNGDNFMVRWMTEIRGNGVETIIDKKYEVAIQLFGTGGGATPSYNAGGYRYPAAEDLKKLELAATSETRKILGFSCKKFTYTYKKIFGEVWLTEEVKLPNDVGVFRACKMAALHNTLSVPGFVMEMTTEDARGGKTIMKTSSLQVEEKYSVDLRGADISKAINKVNYFSF